MDIVSTWANSKRRMNAYLISLYNFWWGIIGAKPEVSYYKLLRGVDTYS